MKPAAVFAALGDPTRLRLVSRLCTDGPQSIARLTEGTKITRQGVTKHLETLAGAGLVASTRTGKERIWRMRPEPLEDAKRYLDDISSQWDQAIERLRRFVGG